MKSTSRIPHLVPTLFLVILLVVPSGLFAQSTGIRTPPGQPPRNQRTLPASASIGDIRNAPDPMLSPSAFSFLTSRQVNVDTGNHVNDFAPVIALSKDGEVYIAWNGDETIKSILFARSTDGGRTFSAPVKINDEVVYPPSYSVYQPDLALDREGNIYVVWHDYRRWADDQSWTSPIDVFIDKSTDGGGTWTTDVQVSAGNGTYPWHFQPSIAVDRKSGNIYVSFTDYDRYYPQGDAGDVSVAVSFDRGVSFLSKVRVDDTPDSLHAVQGFSSVALDSSRNSVVVAFDDTRNGRKDIYLAASYDSAQSFRPNTLVNDDTTNDQEEPAVQVSNSGRAYVVWKDWRADPTPTEAPYDNDMFIAASADGGSTFAPGVKINDVHLNGEYSYNFPPRLAIDDSGIVHVTWFDSRFGYTNCFYDESVDGGATFNGDAIVNDNHDSLSHSLPRIAAGNGRTVVVYMDKRNGNNFYDIFCAAEDRPTGTEDVPLAPADFALEQNYPNPFNPTTTIRFDLPERTHVRVAIYNVPGQLVMTLADGQMEAGVHRVQLDARRLATGMYFYRMTAGSFTAVRKMLFVK